MVNRSIEAKRLKMKRRGRYAVFSGSDSKYAVRVGPTPLTEDAQGRTETKETIMVPVGPIHLSKQVMSTGRGPDAERMAEYYARLSSFLEEIPATRTGHFSTPRCEMFLRYEEILKDTKNYRICLANNKTGRLDLFFRDGKKEWFFVEEDLLKKYIRRSRMYGSKEFALARLKIKGITWVEYLNLPTKIS